MKLYPILFNILLISIMFQVYGQRADLKPYGIKSGKIDYKYSGTQEGIGTLYFDDHGQRSTIFEDLVENGIHRKSYTLTIGEDQYIYDLDKPGEGVKMKNPFFRELKRGDDGAILLKRMFERMGLGKAGKIIFRDRQCDLWKGEQGEALTWNGILLKLDLEMYGNAIHQEATSIKINDPIDPSIFEIPESVEFMEIPGFNF